MDGDADRGACPDENSLTRFVQGEASASERSDVERHVDRCAACSELLANLAYAYFDAPADDTRPEAPLAKRDDRTVAADPEPTATVAPRSEADTRVANVIASGTIVGGRYELGPRIGRGGMGVVYAGRDPVLRRPIAVKVMNALAARADDERLLREARAMARVAHPDVVTVYDAGHFGDRVFVVMELVRGPSLRRWLESRPDATFEEVLALFIGAGRGLVAAHESHVVHRDFKPENVLVDPRERSRVTDFGLAQPMVPAEEPSSPHSLGRKQWLDERVTRAAGGTLAYMSPEQIDGRVVDERSDQFSFGVALYEAAYGAHPFFGPREALRAVPSLGDLRKLIPHGPRPPPENSKTPVWLWPVVERALATAPEDRWKDMSELVGALERGDQGRAEWHIGAHVVGLGIMFFLHLLVTLLIPIGLMVPDDPSAPAPNHWGYDLVAGALAMLVGSGWAPLGMAMTVACAYGMFRRRRWAYVTTAVYAAVAFFTCFGTPYALFALYSLTRPYVREALGRTRGAKSKKATPKSS